MFLALSASAAPAKSMATALTVRQKRLPTTPVPITWKSSTSTARKASAGQAPPALAELMVDLEENGHGVKTVIVEKLDRLARDLMVQEAVIRDFQKHGFDLISATEGHNLLSEDPTRRFVRQVFGALAEYDKSMLVSKLRAARERVKAKTGKCDGRKGYYETDHGKAVLARTKQLRRKRRDMKPLSFADIADVLNKEGMLTLTGKPWTGGNVTAATRRNQSR